MQASSEENSAHKDDHEVILEWREDMVSFSTFDILLFPWITYILWMY